MRKWIFLTAFLVSTGLVSIGMNLRVSPQEEMGQRAARLIEERRFAEAVPLLEQLAVENKDNPQMRFTLEKNILFCRAHMGADAMPAMREIAAPASAPASQPGTVVDPSTGVARVPHEKPAAGATLTLTIKELGNFPFDPVIDETVPADVLALNGVHVTLTGFITPFQEADSLTEFALQPSLAGCCFGQPSGVEHTIICHAKAEKHIEYVQTEVIVTGRLVVVPLRENDYTHTVFQLDVESVKEKP